MAESQEDASVLYSEVSVPSREASTKETDAASACDDDNILYSTLDFRAADGISSKSSTDDKADTSVCAAAENDAQPLDIEFDSSVNPKASPWYHGTISAETVASLLTDKDDGTFLVRQESDMLFELVMVENGGIVGRQVSRREKRYRFDTGRERGLSSKTLAGLIDLVRVPSSRWATPLQAFVPRHLATEDRVRQEHEHAAKVLQEAESTRSGIATNNVAAGSPPTVQPWVSKLQQPVAGVQRAKSGDHIIPDVPTTAKPVIASLSAEDFGDDNPKHRHKYENLPRFHGNTGASDGGEGQQDYGVTTAAKRDSGDHRPASRTQSRSASPVTDTPPAAPGPALPVRRQSTGGGRSVYLPAEAVLPTPTPPAPATEQRAAAPSAVLATSKTQRALAGDNMFNNDLTCKRPWYAGEVDRDHCDQFVVQRASQGDFLVRESTSSTNMVLVVHDEGKVINFPIAYRRGKVGLGMVEMDTIDELVEAIKMVPLTSPITRKAVMLRNPIDIHGTGADDNSDDGSSDDGYIHVEEVAGGEPRNSYVMLCVRRLCLLRVLSLGSFVLCACGSWLAWRAVCCMTAVIGSWVSEVFVPCMSGGHEDWTWLVPAEVGALHALHVDARCRAGAVPAGAPRRWLRLRSSARWRHASAIFSAVCSGVRRLPVAAVKRRVGS
eukprot:m.542926 g.542926  ORF g.542926 m.542926 type:complete len:666 (+) comp22122_c0_seq8:258-2255(+)